MIKSPYIKLVDFYSGKDLKIRIANILAMEELVPHLDGSRGTKLHVNHADFCVAGSPDDIELLIRTQV